MKELLYIALFLLLLYVLYVEKSLLNLVIAAVSLLILIIFVLKFKYTYQEHFAITKENMYNDENYRESMNANMKDSLVYYVSSFDKRFIDFGNNSLNNQINSEIGALLTQDLHTFPYDYFNQYNGIKITSKVNCANAKTILESFDTFSIFWYMRIITSKSTFNDTSYSLIQFDHNNIEGKTNSKLLDIRFNFSVGNLNPSIEIYIANTKLPTSYTYTLDDYHANKIFADNKHHLFTFIKESGKVYFYVDNHLLINCDDENCFNNKSLTLYGDDVEIKIRDSLIRVNDNVSNRLILNVNAFGVYRHKALSSDDVKNLHDYYHNVKLHLSPAYLSLTQRNSSLQSELNAHTKACPLSDETICSSRECYDIVDWNNVNTIMSNVECFHKVVNYCNGLSSYENDKICSFMKKDNIFKMASTLDSNLFMYNPNNNQGNLDETINKKILTRLDQLGLKNIYLDKSFRDNRGKYSGEMERLVNDLLQTNQTVDINTLENLYSDQVNTKITDDIDYNKLHNNQAFSNDSSYTNMYNSLLAQEATSSSVPSVKDVNLDRSSNDNLNQLNNDLIDLSYDDVGNPNAYEHILNKHKQDKIEKEIGNSWNFLNGWF